MNTNFLRTKNTNFIKSINLLNSKRLSNLKLRRKTIPVYERIIDIVIQQAKELNEELANKIPLEQGADAPLFGKDGVLDSIALVTLIVAVEQAVEDEFDTALTIADEKAMSQKISPFRTVGSLAEYIQKLVKGEI